MLSGFNDGPVIYYYGNLITVLFERSNTIKVRLRFFSVSVSVLLNHGLAKLIGIVGKELSRVCHQMELGKSRIDIYG